MLLKQWKRRRFIVRKLISFGVRPKTAWRNVYDRRKSLWALSHAPAVHQGLRPTYFADRGLMSIVGKWKLSPKHIDVPRQLALALGYFRGRKTTDDGGHNPSPRRAGCEQHLSGSVRGAPGDRGAYSVRDVVPPRCPPWSAISARQGCAAGQAAKRRLRPRCSRALRLSAVRAARCRSSSSCWPAS